MGAWGSFSFLRAMLGWVIYIGFGETETINNWGPLWCYKETRRPRMSNVYHFFLRMSSTWTFLLERAWVESLRMNLHFRCACCSSSCAQGDVRCKTRALRSILSLKKYPCFKITCCATQKHYMLRFALHFTIEEAASTTQEGPHEALSMDWLDAGLSLFHMIPRLSLQNLGIISLSCLLVGT